MNPFNIHKIEIEDKIQNELNKKNLINKDN
jgi:hypothetical protein